MAKLGDGGEYNPMTSPTQRAGADVPVYYITGHDWDFEEDPSPDERSWVRYTDYAALQARIAELEARADVSWQTWPEVRRAFCALMTDLSLRLKSGNSVPVERTHLTAAEFAVIEQHALACEDISWKQYDAMSEVRERAEAAEARNAASERDAVKWRAWIAAQQRIESELPEGYAIELYCSPGDWSISLYDPAGKDLEIVDFDSAEDFVSRAIERAKEHAAIDAHAQGQA